MWVTTMAGFVELNHRSLSLSRSRCSLLAGSLPASLLTSFWGLFGYVASVGKRWRARGAAIQLVCALFGPKKSDNAHKILFNTFIKSSAGVHRTEGGLFNAAKIFVQANCLHFVN